uniref:Putative acyl-glucose-dependent anthocyanin acyltransferase n=2 Tax=Delphinium grandiflorum TaxID=85439 RepID=U6C5K7_DELGR|nr:putative acyl-glucose-dependent anthocyanin acyltransferase [Delphinium grandiflorum]
MEFQLSPSPCFLLLLLLLVLQFSSRVHSQSIVRYLPGFDGPLPFHLETGYVSIGDADGAELFYYFFQSENKPSDDPILFWFTGGPGCSGLSAVTFENGPLSFKISKYNGSLPTLKLNPYSWTKVSNIVFLDAPPGTGFSYSRNLKGYPSDKKSSKQGYIFIRKWLVDHQKFLSNPLYISGDSYSGITIPPIGQYIFDGIESGDELLINFKGYLLGNPKTDLYYDHNSKIPFAHGMALLSTELFESVKKNCGGEYYNADPENVQCRKDLQLVSECTKGVNDPHILEPKCLLVTPKSNKWNKRRSSLEMTLPNNLRFPFGIPEFGCRSYGYMLSYYWANDKEVQKALHIRKDTVPEWIRCNQEGLNYLYDNISSIGYHLYLSRKGCRSLIYSGDHDFLVPFLSTETWITSLNYSITDDWRPWFVGGQVAGYTRSYANNMTFATVKGAGHTAPEYKPYECFSMMKKWLSYEPL